MSWRWGPALLLCVALGGCTILIGTLDYVGPGDAGVVDGDDDDDDDDDDAGVVDGGVVDGGVPCDPDEPPSGPAIFVSASFASPVGDGSEALPFQTIAAGLDAAAGAGATLVILDEGTYAEPVVLEARHAGIFIEGGWVRVGADWSRDCGAGDIRARTIIASPLAIGVHVVDTLATRAGLRALSVFTKPAGAVVDDVAGESVYGVFVGAPDTPFALEDVVVRAGDGGDGGLATAFEPGEAASCANLVSGCDDGADGVDGVDGPDATAGTFGATGYVAGDGVDGTPGSAGHNGTGGTAGETRTDCVNGCRNDGGCNCPTSCNCSFDFNVTQSGGHGTCGCGGDGARGGAAGAGGGASVAVFVAGVGSSVNATGALLEAQSGGDGSDGMPFLAGALGGDGADGADGGCETSCANGGVCGNCGGIVSPLAGGNAGGPAGDGGDGGAGGGGAGGASFAVVVVGGATFTQTNSELVFAAGGAGGGGAPAGVEGDLLNVP